MSETKKKSAWGKGIAVLYGGFVLFTFALVFFSTQNDVQLVSADYYQQEIRHQEQIDRVERTIAQTESLSIRHDLSSNELILEFPESSMSKQLSGTVRFFRPSDASLDFSVAVAPEIGGNQKINLSELTRGLWKVKVLWSEDGVEYFRERNIILE